MRDFQFVQDDFDGIGFLKSRCIHLSNYLSKMFNNFTARFYVFSLLFFFYNWTVDAIWKDSAFLFLQLTVDGIWKDSIDDIWNSKNITH